MWATVSTSPVRQSWTTHGTRPRSSYAICESSTDAIWTPSTRPILGRAALLDPQPVEQTLVGAPVPAYADGQLQMHVHVQLALDRPACGHPDRLDHLPPGADHDPLLRLGLHQQHRLDPDQVLALAPDRLDLHLDRVGHLLTRAPQHLLAHALGEPHVFGLIRELRGPEVERPLRQQRGQVLAQRRHPRT